MDKEPVRLSKPSILVISIKEWKSAAHRALSIVVTCTLLLIALYKACRKFLISDKCFF